MAASKLPDIAFLRECLDYDPATGGFTWRERPRRHFVSDRGWWQWNPKLAGKAAGYWCRGYLTIRVDRRLYPGHRLAWLFVHGTDPWPDEIDHIDGNPSNNRISNLRVANRSEQMMNRRITDGGIRSSKTGAKGVTLNGDRRGYDARITVNGKVHYIGYFRTIEEAAEARRKAAIALHGEFARHE